MNAFLPIVVWLIILAQTGFSAPSRTADDSLFPPDIQRIKNRDTLVVAQFKGFRPGFFVYDDEKRCPGGNAYDYEGHRLVGYDIDLSYRIAHELGVKLKFIRTFEDFNEVCRAVARGDADMGVSKLSITYNRAQFIRYSVPYARLRMGFLINRVAESKYGADRELLTLCNQRGARIGVITGTSFMDFGAEILPKATIVNYPEYQSLFDAAKKGNVLASFYEEFEIERCLRTKSDMQIFCRAQYLPDKEDRIAIAVHPDNTMLLSFVNLFLERENVQPSVDEILTRYFPPEVFTDSTATTQPPASGAVITMLVVIFAAVAGIWLSFAVPGFRAKQAGRNNNDEAQAHEQ